MSTDATLSALAKVATCICSCPIVLSSFDTYSAVGPAKGIGNEVSLAARSAARFVGARVISSAIRDEEEENIDVSSVERPGGDTLSLEWRISCSGRPLGSDSSTSCVWLCSCMSSASFGGPDCRSSIRAIVSKVIDGVEIGADWVDDLAEGDRPTTA